MMVSRVAYAGCWLVGSWLMTSSSFGQAPLTPRLDVPADDPASLSIEYDPANGDFRAYQPASAVSRIASLEINSASGIFVSDAMLNCEPGFVFQGVLRPEKFFNLVADGTAEFRCPAGMQAGLSPDFVAGDLSVSGRLLDGTDLSDVVLVVPEPSFGALGLIVATLGMRTRRRVDYSVRRVSG